MVVRAVKVLILETANIIAGDAKSELSANASNPISVATIGTCINTFTNFLFNTSCDTVYIIFGHRKAVSCKAKTTYTAGSSHPSQEKLPASASCPLAAASLRRIGRLADNVDRCVPAMWL